MSDDELDDNSDDEHGFIITIIISNHWTNFRNTLVLDLFNGRRERVRQSYYNI